MSAVLSLSRHGNMIKVIAIISQQVFSRHYLYMANMSTSVFNHQIWRATQTAKSNRPPAKRDVKISAHCDKCRSMSLIWSAQGK